MTTTTHRYLATGNRAMALSGTAMLIGIGAAYPFSHHLGIALQVIAHLSIAIAAGVFKLGYVIRLAAQHEIARAAAAHDGRAPDATAPRPQVPQKVWYPAIASAGAGSA